ncbi:MAG: methyltransferase domain-containing protein, partial [Pseudomonadales bacterium]|nr:methyltransferase domain-containing protein [Pseudomonadales bacterium]
MEGCTGRRTATRFCREQRAGRLLGRFHGNGYRCAFRVRRASNQLRGLRTRRAQTGELGIRGGRRRHHHSAAVRLPMGRCRCRKRTRYRLVQCIRFERKDHAYQPRWTHGYPAIRRRSLGSVLSPAYRQQVKWFDYMNKSNPARDRWNERYASRDLVWSSGPNETISREASDLPPGSALDLGCGEGRNAIWLAEQGWSATAIDFADEAIKKGRQIAEARNLSIDWIVDDVTTWT